MILLDIDMPDKCNTCKLCKYVETDENNWAGGYRCAVTNINVNASIMRMEKYPECPIVREVKTERITREEIKNAIKTLRTRGIHELRAEEIGGMQDAIDIAVACLENQKIGKLREVFIKVDKISPARKLNYCSICKCGGFNLILKNDECCRCPNCGAILEEENGLSSKKGGEA